VVDLFQLDGTPQGEYHKIPWEIRKDINKKENRYDNQSTTPAAKSLYNTLTIIVLRPPLLQKGGENSLLCIF
jgi:hypothetical protein